MKLLSLVGLLISLYLAQQYSAPGSVGCVLSHSGGCDIVRASEYSWFLGVRVPFWGVLFFWSYLLFCLIEIQSLRNYKPLVLMLFSGSGALFAIYLLYLQKSVIEAFCTWCVFTEITTFLLFIFSVKHYFAYTTKSDSEGVSEKTSTTGAPS